MKNRKISKTGVYVAALLVYIGVLLCAVLFTRGSMGKESLQTELFWGYKTNDPKILYADNLYNILSYIPIGCLVGLIVPKHKLLTAMLLGLFLSETIECSQLIWHKGTFDVDDLFNNTVGAIMGALIVILTTWIRNKVTKNELKQ